MESSSLEKKDDTIIASIIRTCLIEYSGDHRSDTAWGDPYLEHFSDVYVLDNNAYWVCENENGEVVAGVGIGPMDGVDSICELQKMYCLKEYRGTGMAQELLDQAILFASKYYKAIYLETLDNMFRAMKFYERNGFVKTDETIGSTGHSGCQSHYIKYLK